MKKHKNIFGWLLILLTLMSCTLESQFSLNNDEVINEGLLGVWSDENNEGFLKFEKYNDKTYKVTLIEPENSEKKEKELLAFTSTIKGVQLLNLIINDRDVVTNSFYGIKLEGNALTVYDINKKDVKKDFKSKAKLLKFFQKNITKKDFLINPIYLKKLN